jgi:hypothetical protein
MLLDARPSVLRPPPRTGDSALEQTLAFMRVARVLDTASVGTQ